MREQCRLAGVARSGLYYAPAPESAENLELMRRLDEQYTRTPFYGVLRMTEWLRKQGYEVNPKRVRRLLRQMGLEAIYARPRLSIPAPGHRIYPYRLRGLPIVRPNQVWGTDITYIRMRHGFAYLVAIMDWFSRYVLAWEVSVTLDVSFCMAALQWALSEVQPEIFNSDQGSQFTSESFTSLLLAHGIDISMDGRGRAMDNIFVERLWRTVKYEEVYLNDYEDVRQAIGRLRGYFQFYNQERLHQSLGYRTPAEIYFGNGTEAWNGRKMAMVIVGEQADRPS
jgi:putative transposase